MRSLIFQIIIFGVYIITASRFHLKFRRDSTATAAAENVPWKASLNMLYMTSCMVMVRNIFRVVEYAMGSDGYLLGVEWGVYVFDAALMTLTMGIFLWWYPSQLKTAIDAHNLRQVGSRKEKRARQAK